MYRCVASGTNDLANQEVFEMASAKDPKGERTIGAITKCDLVPDKQMVYSWINSEPTIHANASQTVSLANNKLKVLKHGWFLVRNRTPEEVEQGISPSRLQCLETELFDDLPWNQVSEKRRGTQALMKFLAGLLCDRIQSTFPSLLANIRERKKSTKGQLESLGPERKSLAKKRAYLTKIAQDFSSMASQALNGRYDPSFPSTMKLRMLVREANDNFAKNMTHNGHTVTFVDISEEKPWLDLEPYGPIGSLFNSSTFGAALQRTAPNDGTSSFAPVASNSSQKTLSSPAANGGFGSSPSSNPPISSQPLASYSFGSSPLSNSFNSQKAAPLGGAAERTTSITAPQTSGTDLFGGGFGLSNGLSTDVSSQYIPIVDEPFKPHYYHSGSGEKELYQTLGTMPAYVNSSFEEIRLNYYNQGTIGKQSTQSTKSPGLDVGGKATSRTKNLEKQQTVHPAMSQTTNPFGLGEQNSGGVYEWIRSGVRSCKGTELQGTVNPDVLPLLFHKQAQKWITLSESHFERIRALTIATTDQIVSKVSSDVMTPSKIRSLIRKRNENAATTHGTRLSSHFNDIVSKHLQTQNEAFEKKIREARLLRFQTALQRYANSKKPAFGQTASTPESEYELKIDLRETEALFAELHISNSQNLANEIHDTLKAYYEIKREDFIEFVTGLIVESYLYDVEGPMMFLSPVHVAELTDSEIEDLAAEHETVGADRARKEATLEILTRAERIAMNYI